MFFRVQPLSKRLIWGSDKLTKLFDLKEDKIGEYWIIGSDNLINENSSITLEEYAKNNSEYLYGKNNIFPRFPVLIKYISTSDWLSVQVHPDDNYAKIKEKEPWGKTEIWYFLETEKKSKIIYGFKDNIKKEEIAELINTKDFEKYLNYVEVNKDDWILIKSGVVHAIGTGITILEIQMNSSMTYRLYDWNRKDLNGSPRELSINKAIDVTDMKNNEEVIRGKNDLNIDISSFSIKTMKINKEAKFDTKSKTFHIILPIKGNLILDNKEIIKENSCILIPAGHGEYKINCDSDNKFFFIYLKEGELSCQV
jgi:mannose-6-phosphate isomerase